MSSMVKKGPASTSPKHGKRSDRRLWSKTRRGEGKRETHSDNSFKVLVCDKTARVYRGSSPFNPWETFPSHGAAVQFAVDYETRMNHKGN